MALYAIGDLHLSLNSDKPMDIFGEKWQGYVDKIRAGFAPLHDDDVTELGHESGGVTGGLPVHPRPAGEEDPDEGQPRLLVEYRVQDAAFF